jgi:succinate dehydrogenase / fumarate reductase iron-sulfur subunit
MLPLPLPKNSRVQKGKTFPLPHKTENVKEFHVYRYNPESPENPRIDVYPLDLNECGPMVLDALLKIKNEIDSTLTFRRSCREGVCGSCAMNIDGTNTLACIKPIEDIRGDVAIYPLPHMPVIKDLIPDLSHAYEQYASLEPWVQNDKIPEDGREAYCS